MLGRMAEREDDVSAGIVEPQAQAKTLSGPNLRCGAHDALGGQLVEASDPIIGSVVAPVRIRRPAFHPSSPPISLTQMNTACGHASAFFFCPTVR